MLTSTASLNGHDYLVEVSPALLLGPVASALAVVVLLVAAVRRPWAGAAVVVVGALGVGSVLLLRTGPHSVPTLATTFPRLDTFVLVSAVTAGCALLLALIAAVVELTLRRTSHAVAALVVVALAGAGLALAHAARTQWKAAWNLPGFVVPSLEGHVGATLSLTPRWATQARRVCHSALLVFESCSWKAELSPPTDAPPHCHADPVEVRLDAKGLVAARATGRCQHDWFSLSVTRPVEARAFEERGDARLPIRVGNRWRYELVHRVTQARVLWVLGGAVVKTRTGETLTLEVTRVVREGGFRGFELEVTVKERRQRAVVVAADDALWLLRDGARVPLITTVEQGVSFALVGEVVEWQRGGDGRLAGPAGWAHRDGPSNVGAVIAMALTIGLAVPPMVHASWELVETREGDGEAVEATPLPPPPEPLVLPPRRGGQKARVDLDVVTGVRGRAEVEQALREQATRFNRCLDESPRAKGPYQLRFTVSTTGSLATPPVKGPDERLALCLRLALTRLRFGAGSGETVVEATLGW